MVGALEVLHCHERNDNARHHALQQNSQECDGYRQIEAEQVTRPELVHNTGVDDGIDDEEQAKYHRSHDGGNDTGAEAVQIGHLVVADALIVRNGHAYTNGQHNTIEEAELYPLSEMKQGSQEEIYNHTSGREEAVSDAVFFGGDGYVIHNTEGKKSMMKTRNASELQPSRHC